MIISGRIDSTVAIADLRRNRPWEKQAISTCHFAAKNPSVSLMDPRSAQAMTPREQVGREAVPRN